METLPPETPQPIEPRAALLKPAPTRFPIFLGPDGLRAGWSILIYLVVLGGLIWISGFELRWFSKHLHQKFGIGEFHPTIAVISEVTLLLAVVLATALMAWLEHRRVDFYGLAGVGRVRQFLIGLVAGFGFLSLLVGILVATHHLSITPAHMPLGQATAYAAAWALCFFAVGMTEELMLRGYLLFTLARGIWFWPAAFVLAALFGFLHKGNPGESPFGLVAAALIAIVFSLSLWRLGHLWWAIGFHTSWDWAESYFYGTADSGTVSYGRLMHAHPAGSVLVSGGMTGPEGSAWILLIVVLVAIFVWVTQPQHGLQFHHGSAVAESPLSQQTQNS